MNKIRARAVATSADSGDRIAQAIRRATSAINREDISAYCGCLPSLTSDELHKEIWLLEEHVRHLKESTEDLTKISHYSNMIRAAREEKDRRAVEKGYI